MSLLLFMPINGFLSLPHIASIKTAISLGKENTKEEIDIFVRNLINIVNVLRKWGVFDGSIN